MIAQILSQYLGSHKRLVIPQLGTLIVKEPGRSVVFSELLKRDDGTLRGLLIEQGRSELEAAGEIDRLVFEVRHAIEHGEQYRIEGLGVMKAGQSGTIAFVYDPTPTPPPAPQPPAPELPATQTETPEPQLTPSVKLNPDSCLKGLRYGKRPKNTNAYTFVGESSRRWKVDRFLLFAFLAAIVAIAAIAFGYFQASHKEPVPTEQTDSEAGSEVDLGADSAAGADSTQLVTPEEQPQ